MLIQRGTVIAVDSHHTLVRFADAGQCAACAAGKGCGAGIFNRLIQRGEPELRLAGPSGGSAPRVGDQVLVGLEDGVLLRAAVITYGVPLLLLLGLVAAVPWLAAQAGLSDGLGEGLAVLAVVPAFLLLWRRRRRQDGQWAERARIVTVHPTATPDCAPGH